jgi:hypothetical protein
MAMPAHRKIWRGRLPGAMCTARERRRRHAPRHASRACQPASSARPTHASARPFWRKSGVAFAWEATRGRDFRTSCDEDGDQRSDNGGIGQAIQGMLSGRASDPMRGCVIFSGEWGERGFPGMCFDRRAASAPPACGSKLEGVPQSAPLPDPPDRRAARPARRASALQPGRLRLTERAGRRRSTGHWALRCHGGTCGRGVTADLCAPAEKTFPKRIGDDVPMLLVNRMPLGCGMCRGGRLVLGNSHAPRLRVNQ